jgi:hypothetical protein
LIISVGFPSEAEMELDADLVAGRIQQPSDNLHLIRLFSAVGGKHQELADPWKLGLFDFSPGSWSRL